MPDIPQEILDKIISYATADEPDDVGRKNFSNCASFVSHNFHQIILPYKFRSLTFQLHKYPYGESRKKSFRKATPVDPIPKFFKAINAGDAHALSLAPLLQELSLFGDSIYLMEPLQIKAVISFRNLTNLKMEKCIISGAIMEQLGKLVQLQSLHTRCCENEGYNDSAHAAALSNLQSLHTLECQGNWKNFRRYLTFIPMKNLRILKSDDREIIKALLTSDPPLQLKEICIIRYNDYSLLWNYLARATSLTHLSLRHLRLSYDFPSLSFPFQELQYLEIHIAFAPRFENQPLKEMKIDTSSGIGELMVEVRQRWQGTVFPHVERLEVDRQYDELNKVPIEFWREFLLNVKEVVSSFR